MKGYSFKSDINSALKILLSDGTILYPTDTIWGIGCDATKPLAIKKIFELKKRSQKKSMIILVANAAMINGLVANPDEKLLSYISSSPKPTTAIFENAIHLPTELINVDGSIAIRIVHDEFCRQLIQQLNNPIISTSANISGEAFPQTFSEISKEIKNGVDFIVQHRQNAPSQSTPSSIIKLNRYNEIEFIRK